MLTAGYTVGVGALFIGLSVLYGLGGVLVPHGSSQIESLDLLIYAVAGCVVAGGLLARTYVVPVSELRERRHILRSRLCFYTIAPYFARGHGVASGVLPASHVCDPSFSAANVAWLTIRSSGPLRVVAVLSGRGQQRPLNSSVRHHDRYVQYLSEVV